MKRMATLTGACATIALVGVLVLAAGCASEEKPKPSPTAATPAPKPVSLTQVKTELNEAKAQVDATSDAVNALQKSSPADAQANYDKFTDEYLKLKAKADQVRSRADNLRAKARDYYAMWDKQAEVQNPEIRRQALEQKADTERTYSSITSELELTRLAFGPYVSNLKDIGNYLRSHLSPASIKSTSDVSAKAIAQGQEVNKHIDAIIGSINKLMAATGEGIPAAAVPAVPSSAPAAASK